MSNKVPNYVWQNFIDYLDNIRIEADLDGDEYLDMLLRISREIAERTYLFINEE